MNKQAKINTEATRDSAKLIKADPASPALIVLESGGIAIKSGTIFNGRSFDEDTAVSLPEGGLMPGWDYAVLVGEHCNAVLFVEFPADSLVLGGFHFAPGSIAIERNGGGETPAINPYSLWDVNFRPACADPRGMALVEKPDGKFWSDIYLLGVDHVTDGTSRFGVTIADGDDCPLNPATSKAFKKLDYETAVAVLAHHGKQVPSIEEFFALAIGVTERTACEDDPVTTKLDAERTSKFGIMQATGNMWVWGHDGDPDEPRASIFGGSWWSDGYAGSRYASVDDWAGYSYGRLGARGRSDHLQRA